MSQASWYYALNGAQQGPFTFEQMKQFVTANIIHPETPVWSGVGDWISLKDTELGNGAPRTSAPPPLAANQIDNRFAWGLVWAQLIFGLIEMVAGSTIWWLFIGVNVGLCVADEKRLKAAGHPAPNSWWCLLVPVYLWKRANLLGQSKNYFFAWVAAFVVAVVLSTAGAQSVIEETACPLVTDIIHKQFFQGSSCVKVTIDDEPKTGFYRATALLDNGNEINITIEEIGDQIQVRVPSQ